MTAFRRITMMAFIVAIVAFAASIGASKALAVCPALTINNPTPITITIKLIDAGGTTSSYPAPPGASFWPGFVPVGAVSAAGTIVPMNAPPPPLCTPCMMTFISIPPGQICCSICYDPATCTININVTPCTTGPCIP